MKKAIFLLLFSLFSVTVTQVVIADNITDKPKKVKVCDSEADFDLVSEPVVSVAVEMPMIFPTIREIYFREPDVGNRRLFLIYYNEKLPRIKPSHPDHWLIDSKRYRCRCLGASV